MKFLLPIILVCAFLLGLRPAFGSDPRSEVLSLEKELEKRINPIVRSYDPSAFGIVKIQAKQSQSEVLPGTPLHVQDMLVRSPSGSFEIEKLEINLIGNDAEALRDAQPAIKRVVARLDAPPVIRIEKKNVPAQTEQKDVTEKSDVKSTSSGAEIVTKDVINLLREALAYLKNALWVILGVSVLLCLVSLSGIGAMTGKVSRSLEKGLKSLSGEGAAGRIPRDEKMALAPATLRAAEISSFSSRSGSTPISEFSEESLLACLTDCYWGEYDGYAAFLWKQIPVSKRTSLILNAPYLVEYTSFISDIPAVDIGAIDSPAYLKSLPITHLDNRAVTDQVKRNSALAANLSPLRLKSLQLNLNERFKLRESLQRPGLTIGGVNFAQMPMSPPRKIVRKFKIEVSSVAEDKELLGLAKPPFDLVDEICSLSWLTYLPAEDLKSLIEGFSARDLATAWVGPEEVLDAVTRSLPAKKLELLRSAQTKVQPSRDSQAFKMIHLALAKQLKRRSLSPEVGGGREGEVAHDRQKRAA